MIRPSHASMNGARELATLFGTASVLSLANATDALAQGEVVAQAEEIPETVLITGSLIRGTAAVGVPVTNLTPQDFAKTGALNTADLFRAFPAANVMPAGVATNSGATIERGVKVNIRGLDTGTATRSLLDGRRHPLPGPGQRPVHHRSLDHSGALAWTTSTSWWMARRRPTARTRSRGVINIILKRNMDGAITQLRWTAGAGGKNRYLASAVWGRTWDGGQVTLSYEWYNDPPTMGNFHSKFGIDFTPWGFDDRRPLGSSVPAILSTGAARPTRRRHPASARPRTSATAAPIAMRFRSAPARTGIPAPAASARRRRSSAATLELVDVQHRGQFGHATA